MTLSDDDVGMVQKPVDGGRGQRLRHDLVESRGGADCSILLDAVVIRCLVVPAVQQMLGKPAWWLPAPLARKLPTVSIERPEHDSSV